MSLHDAVGHVLADDVSAPDSMPPFPASIKVIKGYHTCCMILDHRLDLESRHMVMNEANLVVLVPHTSMNSSHNRAMALYVRRLALLVQPEFRSGQEGYAVRYAEGAGEHDGPQQGLQASSFPPGKCPTLAQVQFNLVTTKCQHTHTPCRRVKTNSAH